MSFRKLDSEMQTVSCSSPATKHQQKQVRDDESAFEWRIKANVQSMEDNISKIINQINLSQRAFLPVPVDKSLDASVELCRRLSNETAQLFEDWQVQLAKEPAERHLKRYLYEKLRKAFEAELEYFKEVDRQAAVAWWGAQESEHRQKHSSSARCGSHDEAESPRSVSSQGCGVGFHGAEGMSRKDQDEPQMVKESKEVCSASARETVAKHSVVPAATQAATPPATQMFRMHQMFSDLNGFDKQAAAVAFCTRLANQELEKAATLEAQKAKDRQHRGTRVHFWRILLAAFALMCFVALPRLLAVGPQHILAVFISIHPEKFLAATATRNQVSGVSSFHITERVSNMPGHRLRSGQPPVFAQGTPPPETKSSGGFDAGEEGDMGWSQSSWTLQSRVSPRVVGTGGKQPPSQPSRPSLRGN